jgi:hypothetical protein
MNVESAIDGSWFFSGGFVLVFILFVVNSKTLFLYPDKLVEKRFILKESVVIYFKEVDQIEFENLVYSRPWQYAGWRNNTHYRRNILFKFFDGSQYVFKIDDYPREEEIKNELKTLITESNRI